ncbi:extracellular matrix protein A-like [Haliotis rubra]|uniref:extracellular matrix protein A-like n=1 Tax=Haliotis rubra TaxID=36100 RepID=UPI001EE5A28E|nr:extracellular matrix protein A-like [Haliotis rubra]
MTSRLYGIFVLAAVLGAALSNIVKRSSDGSCNCNGTVVANGDYFNYACVLYKCVDGVQTCEKKECEHEGACYAQGTTMTINCYNHTCKISGGTIGFKKDAGQSTQCPYGDECYGVGPIGSCATCNSDGTVLQKCQHNGDCIAVGETVDLYCSTYECVNVGNVYRLTVKIPKCEIDSNCHDVNTTFNCLQCKVDANNEPYIVKECAYDDSCYTSGSQITHQCYNYTCQTDTTVGFVPDADQPIRCYDNGICAGVGAMDNCKTCGADGKIMYKCPHGDACYDSGVEKTIGCHTYTCKTDTSVGFVENPGQQKRCYYEGQCHGVGYLGNCATCESDETVTQKCIVGSECVAEGETKTVGCSTVQCIREGNTYRPSYIQPGCSIGGSCHAAGSTVNCIKCRVDANNEPYIDAECEYDTACYTRNQQLTIACYTYTCKTEGGVGFRRDEGQQTRCSYNGNCYGVGDMGDCRTCSSNGKVNYGCQYNGQCYQHDQGITVNCISYKCVVGASIGWHIEAKQCSYGGQCYSVGDMGGCKTCRSDGTIEYRCSFGGNCYSESQTLDYYCVKYACHVGETSIGFVLVANQSTRCVYDNQCYDVGDMGGCRTCQSDGDVEHKCSYKGACYSHGQQTTIDCYESTCEVGQTSLNFVKNSGQPTQCSYGGACYQVGSMGGCMTCNSDRSVTHECSHDGQCYPNGHKLTLSCTQYTCQVGSTVGFVKDTAQETKCNYYGVCYPVGEIQACRTCQSDGTIKYECSFDGRCYEHNDQITLGCYNYTCQVGSTIGFKKNVGQPTKCSYNSECYGVGDIYDCASCASDGSVTYKCLHDNSCIPENDKVKIGCADHICTINSTHRFLVKDTSQPAQCSYNGGCVDAGAITPCATCNTDGTVTHTEGCSYTASDGTQSCTASGASGIHAIGGTDYNCTCTVANGASSSSCAYI